MPFHKFNVGDIVSLKPVNRNVPGSVYEVVKQLPGSSEPEYRIKSINEPHQRLVLLSLNAAVNRDENQLLGEIHLSADRRLIWVAKFRRTVNRGLPRMSRG